MKFPPIYTKNQQINTLLTELDVLKKAFELITPAKQTLTYLRRASHLKSSLYSARIEGNPLELHDVSDTPIDISGSIHKQEIANILKAMSTIDQISTIVVDIPFLLSLHKDVLNEISSSAGKLRIEESAIFNQAGIAVYLAPAPQSISPLLDELCRFCTSENDPIPIKAAISHIWFEKIHPFVDGNGRVGRLLSLAILKTAGYDFGGIVPIEEYIESHRQEYYDVLGKDIQDVTPFIEYYLTAIVSQANKSLVEINNPVPKHRAELLPRRAELLDIIKDHKTVTFDFLTRRFRAIPTSTLHYDLIQLIKKGYIIKLGSTRGTLYAIK